MRVGPKEYREVWAVDFEYAAPPGERPDPVCMVGRELARGRWLRLWRDDLRQLQSAPFATDPEVLVVAYYASSELGCFLALDWPFPANVLDLFTEFRNATNGLPVPCGNGLLGALAYYGIDGLAVAQKDAMRELALRGGPYNDDERRALLDYCASDVTALAKLLPRMMPTLDLPRALLRGRYMAAAARMEYRGVPIDVHVLERLRTYRAALQTRLVERIDVDYGVYDGLTFKLDRFAAWLTRTRIPWPQLASGRLALDDDTFREMANPDFSPG